MTPLPSLSESNPICAVWLCVTHKAWSLSGVAKINLTDRSLIQLRLLYDLNKY